MVAPSSNRLRRGWQLWDELFVVMYADRLAHQMDHPALWWYQAIQTGCSAVPGIGAGRALNRGNMDDYWHRPEDAQNISVLDLTKLVLFQFWLHERREDQNMRIASMST